MCLCFEHNWFTCDFLLGVHGRGKCCRDDGMLSNYSNMRHNDLVEYIGKELAFGVYK